MVIFNLNINVCGFYFCFSFLFVETSLMYWAHGMKDTDTLDIFRDDYLFSSSNIWIQHSNINSQERGLWKEDSVITRIINTSITNH